MDQQTITDVLKFSKENLLDFIESERNIYYEVQDKVNSFYKKGGLNIILVTGLRGTGKTTILKTIAKKYDGIYTTGEFLKLKGISIENTTEIIKTQNKKIIIIDEILYLQDWQILLKIYADTYQKILFIISASSAMQLKNISADLSRRLDIYKLNPLSFKEYLKLKKYPQINKKIKLDIFTLKDVNKMYTELAKIDLDLPKETYMQFQQYYQEQFPFIIDEKNKTNKMIQLVEKIIYKDMPQINNLYTQHLKNAELIIKFLVITEKINYTNIANNLQIKRDLVIKIIDLFVKSDLISIITDIVPTRELRSNKKVLFATPGIRFALNDINEDKVVGFAREDMFGLIMKNSGINIAYNYNQDGFDYLVKGIKFEIGNNKKKVRPGTIVVGDFTQLGLKKEVLYVPFYIFALIND